MQQYVIRDTVSKIKLLEDERASLARDTVRFQRGLEAVHKTIDMPKNGNTSPYNIRDALDATSKAINALKAGDAVTLEPVTLDSDIDTSEEAEADLFLNSIGGLWMTKKEDSLSKSMQSLLRVQKCVSNVH